MSSIIKRIVAVAGWDNRLPIDSDVSERITLALTDGQYTCITCTVSRLVQATMTKPTAGSNQVIAEMQVPAGTADATLIALMTAVLTTLNLPSAPITVGAITIF